MKSLLVSDKGMPLSPLPMHPSLLVPSPSALFEFSSPLALNSLPVETLANNAVQIICNWVNDSLNKNKCQIKVMQFTWLRLTKLLNFDDYKDNMDFEHKSLVPHFQIGFLSQILVTNNIRLACNSHLLQCQSLCFWFTLQCILVQVIVCLNLVMGSY